METPKATSFPAASWLGFGLDLTAVMPLDISTVTSSVLSGERLINLSNSKREVRFDVAHWKDVPKNVAVIRDVSQAQSSDNTWANGEEAAADFKANTSLKAKYLAVQGGGSIDYSVSKSFKKNKQVNMFSYTHRQLLVRLDNYYHDINVPALKTYLKNLKPWNPSDPTIVDSYKELFNSSGSHIITACAYGSILQVTSQADNSNTDINKNFQANVNAAYNGLISSGQFDASVKSQAQYKEFLNSIQKYCSCFGGDATLAMKIQANPQGEDAYKIFQEWAATATLKPNVMSMETTALWDLLSNSHDNELIQRTEDVRNAYYSIIEDTATYTTACVLSIISDIGIFQMLTPWAEIVPDPHHPVDPRLIGQVTMTNTNVTWKSSAQFVFDKVLIYFLIKNDGSPVDIEIAHGADGEAHGDQKGEVTVTIHTQKYENIGPTSNHRNSKTFYQCPVIKSNTRA